MMKGRRDRGLWMGGYFGPGPKKLIAWCEWMDGGGEGVERMQGMMKSRKMNLMMEVTEGTRGQGVNDKKAEKQNQGYTAPMNST